ncbi:MAG: ATP-binding protein, partial [Spirochaetota bacterium]|nr:ATP-binding protein [Spirochaetota bacterium]
MKPFEIKAQKDHLEKISHSKPQFALSEIVWNALDADATRIDISSNYNELGIIDKISVTDNGSGIPYDLAEKYFSSLGGSWKIQELKSPKGRQLHGKQGQGRFKAFSLGHNVDWHVRYLHTDGAVYEFDIFGDEANLNEFNITDRTESNQKETGVTVEITNIAKQFGLFENGSLANTFSTLFAPYLYSYKDICISINDIPIDISSQIQKLIDYDLVSVVENQDTVF